MPTQHTPGPWAIETPLGDDILCVMEAGKAINAAKWIAQIGLEPAEGYRDLEPSFDEHHANARLIVAAPDLLIAAIGLLETFAAGDDSFYDWRTKLDEAVQKAQGESV